MRYESHSMPRHISAALLAVFAAGCLAPTTYEDGIDPSVIDAEQLLQQQLVVQSVFRENQRVQRLAWDFQRATTPMCPLPVRMASGLQVANRRVIDPQYRAAATALGMHDTVMVTHVVPGSAAARAGMRAGDRVLQLDTLPVPEGRAGIDSLSSWINPYESATPWRFMVVRRGPALREVAPDDESAVPVVVDSVPSRVDTLSLPTFTPVCPISAVAVPTSDLNAYTDGREVWVTTGMLRFANDDELRVILGHEFGHAVEKHLDKQMTNVATGAVLGLLLDIFSRSQGAGDSSFTFTSTFANIGSGRFSQAFEHEADYVGMYLLARAGFPVSGAAKIWRKVALENPESIEYATTHPTTAARFARLKQAAQEIEAKRAAGLPLEPNRASPADTSNANGPPEKGDP